MRMRALLATAALATLCATPAASQDGRGNRWERMKRYDADGDGKVTREEFRGPARVFERMDRNGDGAVSEAEARGMPGGGAGGARGAGSGGASRGGRRGADIDWVAKRLDIDHDGTFDESDVAEIRAVADEDGDGKLSEAELLAFLTDAGRPIPRGTAPDVGAVAPAFEVRALEGTGAITLASLVAKERPVVIAFGSLT